MRIARTTYEKLGYQDCPKCFPGEIEEATEESILDYLVSSLNNVILIEAGNGFIAVDLEGACSLSLGDDKFLCYALAHNLEGDTSWTEWESRLR